MNRGKYPTKKGGKIPLFCCRIPKIAETERVKVWRMGKWQEIISNISSKRVFIQTHNFPDPDAISSAFGLQYLLKLSGIESTICYKGKIDRYNTKKMMELFEISAVNIDKLENALAGKDIILIDTQRKNGNTYDLKGDNIISIDHHPIFEHVDYLCSDIRSNVGACASIIASYFIENDIEIPCNVATALLYGIKIDTAQMTRNVSKLDLDMFYMLFMRADKEKIAFLEANSVQLEDLKAYMSAIKTISIDECVSFADTGDDCPEALIAEIADFMVELRDVYFSVVYSARKEGIKISVRSQSNIGCHAGEIVIEALEGLGTGGGHHTMAGGYVSFKNKKETAEELILIIKERFKNIALKYMKTELREIV